ncbi:type I restriction endonuclease subunit R [Microbacterium sp. CFBP9034]|uniref:type I restriction endonuclease subunit R n=1 Tax=Microbacterium sp. CFBP9034 TaxID=3096540 RepID=UPI002A6B3EFB|nr:type I restriction endonuclease [Microbacterium sp. CFBP9034]MDY0909520.1 DEAD/DEAH box helicase family protein [Microbacterium sp. CFBP9034]
MSTDQLMEAEFETNLCEALAERGWIYSDRGNPNLAGWDVARAMVVGDVLHWLATQYPDEYEKAVPSDLVNGALELAQIKLLDHIVKELGKVTKMDPITGHPMGGLLGVLRKGFSFAQVGRPTAKFGPLMAFPPANPNLASVIDQANSVRLRVLRQVRFDTKTTETVDVVLTANGLPVASLELKTDNTQTVNDAIKQYKNDRVPGASRALLAPGRALVHFAVSNDRVYMTTKLAGAETHFLPFNQGDNGHEGNPPSATGSATDYLWREVLARPTFMRIIKDFALYQPGRSKSGDGRLVFPRFHQLRAVERIVADIERVGPGGRYLVEHSAGSGKTKTIAWLSHRLIRHMGVDGTSTFDSIIVVTDRTALDENVRADMRLVQSSMGLIVNVGSESGAKSEHVKNALVEGGHIITCTLQTFPYVMKRIEDTDELRGRRWAIVADEAHSSQTGSSSRALKSLLVDVDLADDEEITADDLLAATDSAIAKSANITFVALTATPKAKTLRLFGTKLDGEERWQAFDNYTMAQAIEEGFILDVLTNYSTYDMFLRVRNALGDEETETEVETGRAVKAIVRFAQLHPTAIAQKVQVVVEHFRRNVLGLLGGEARAMVVTSGRKDAVLWSEKMNSYIANEGYEKELRTLVAFSGTVTNGADQEVTEVSMNGVTDVARAFREEDEYKVLIVANKFQTGFDEPRLVAMYIDKVLTGVATVQTISRLNRIYPGKSAPIVVDFVNSPASIQKDFEQYYTSASINGEFDPNELVTLAERLDSAGLYTADQLDAVVAAYQEKKGGEAIQHSLGPIKHAWVTGLQQAKLAGDKERYDELKQFRSDAISFRNGWQFLSQIVDFSDADLAHRYVLMALLARNLHLTPETYDDSYMEGVQLAGVKVMPGKVGENYALGVGGDNQGLELPSFGTQPRSETAKPQGPIDEAIAKVNELFSAKGIEANPASISGFITAYWGYLDADEEAVAMAKSNTVEQLDSSTKFSDAAEYAAFQAFQDAGEIKKALADADVMDKLIAISAEMMHAKHNARADDDDQAD